MTYVSLFSGICAATAAWKPLGMEPLAFAEIDPFPAELLAQRYSGVPNLGNVSRVDWSPYRGKADVVVGGSPCQAFSVAGLRKSLEDPRGNLTLEYVRAVHAIRPRYAVWENVPGILSTYDNAFGCFLAALVGADEALEAEEGWPSAGMVCGPAGRACWRLLDAQWFGLAQRRLRVFVVFCPGGGADPAEVLFERPRMLGNPPARGEAGKATPGDSVCGAEVGPSGGRFTELAPTLDARCKDSAIRNQIGLLVFGGNNTGGPIDVATACNAHGGSGWLDFETETFVAHALRASGFDASEDGTGRGTPLVPVAFSAKDYGADMGSTSPTLRAMPHHRSHANAGGQVAVCVQEGQTGVREYDTADTVRSDAPGSQPCGSLIRERFAVRRLTPRECERLQGFPDDYTLVPYRGKPAADGPRYRAIGNSMAVPVMAWIGRRIIAAEGGLNE